MCEGQTDDTRYLNYGLMEFSIFPQETKCSQEKRHGWRVIVGVLRGRRGAEGAVHRKIPSTVPAHNHSSRRDGATDGDMHATRRLMDAAEPPSIDVPDHIVLGSSTVSTRESADLEF